MIVEALPLRDQVADIIRRMILKGELLHDEQISERQISQRLNISTTPVKEALRVLHTEGLVYTKPRVGSFVSQIPKEHMMQVVSMRGALEGVAAYYAAIYAMPEELHTLSEVLRQVSVYLEKKEDPLLIAKQNNIFHSILRKASRNEYLVNLIMTMRSIDNTFREMSLEVDQDETGRALKEHIAILDAVKQRNSNLAEQLMNRHIRRVAHSVVTILGE